MSALHICKADMTNFRVIYSLFYDNLLSASDIKTLG